MLYQQLFQQLYNILAIFFVVVPDCQQAFKIVLSYILEILTKLRLVSGEISSILGSTIGKGFVITTYRVCMGTPD